MTAEIAVLNLHGVAMAADTKMSSRSKRGEPLHRDGYQKLFALSEVHPVGIMVYGGAHYGFDAPWEVLIREYRFQKKTASHDTIEEWAEDFFEFVKAYGNGDKDVDGLSLEFVVNDFFQLMEGFIKQEVKPGDIAAFARRAVPYMNVASQQNAKLGPLLTSADTKLLEKRYGALVWNAAARPFCGSDARLLDMAESLAWGAICSARFSRAHSGIVIAGFGARQRFPALVAYKVEGYLGTVFKSRRTDVADLNTYRSASILPFAQSSMIQAFATGMDQESADYIAWELIDEFNGYADYCATHVATSASQAQAMRDRAQQSRQTLKRRIEGYIDHRTKPVVDAVEDLNAPALKAFARALVALESTRHLYSDRTPSVGGNIDVLVMRNTDRHVQVEQGSTII